MADNLHPGIALCLRRALLLSLVGVTSDEMRLETALRGFISYPLNKLSHTSQIDDMWYSWPECQEMMGCDLGKYWVRAVMWESTESELWCGKVLSLSCDVRKHWVWAVIWESTESELWCGKVLSLSCVCGEIADYDTIEKNFRQKNQHKFQFLNNFQFHVTR